MSSHIASPSSPGSSGRRPARTLRAFAGLSVPSPRLLALSALLVGLPAASVLLRSSEKPPETATLLSPALRGKTEALIRAWIPQYTRLQLHSHTGVYTPNVCDVEISTPEGANVAVCEWNLTDNSLLLFARQDALPLSSTLLTSRQAERAATDWLADLHLTAHSADWHCSQPPQQGASYWRLALNCAQVRSLVWIEASTGRLIQYQSSPKRPARLSFAPQASPVHALVAD